MAMNTPLRQAMVDSLFKDSGSFQEQEFFDAEFRAYNKVLKNLAARNGFHYVDIPSRMPIGLEERRAHFSDGLHPSDVGYELIAEVLFQALRFVVEQGDSPETTTP